VKRAPASCGGQKKKRLALLQNRTKGGEKMETKKRKTTQTKKGIRWKGEDRVGFPKKIKEKKKKKGGVGWVFGGSQTKNVGKEKKDHPRRKDPPGLTISEKGRERGKERGAFSQIGGRKGNGTTLAFPPGGGGGKKKRKGEKPPPGKKRGRGMQNQKKNPIVQGG